MNLKYEQIDLEQMEREMLETLDDFRVGDISKKEEALNRFHRLRDHYLTMYWTSYIHYLLDYKNEMWIASEKFFGTAEGKMQEILHTYFVTLTNCDEKEWLEAYVGKRTLQVAEVETKLYRDTVKDAIAKEKEEKMKYLKNIRTVSTMYDGSEKTLAKISPDLVNSDREVRKRANLARFDIFKKIQSENEEVLDQLIKIRNRMAEDLHYPSYVELSYDKLYRFGYCEKDIKAFRQSIVTYLLPLMEQLRKMQRENLKVDALYYYDVPILFSDGLSKPKGDVDEIVREASAMYHEMHPAFGKLFDRMKKEHYMDLEARDEKSNAGICTYLPDQHMPVFIASFHKTNHDINVIRHEFGHSVQLYESRNLRYHENRWPSFDVCEVHSQAMEYFGWNYLDRFFESEEETNRYRIEKLVHDLELLLYACQVDEFQHEIYHHPEYSKQKRNEVWNQLDEKYQPYVDKEQNDYLLHGAGWQKQSHIITDPFYYIDYALSLTVALQFFVQMEKDEKKAYEDYLKFCRMGGSKSFVEYIDALGFSSPFEPETIREIANILESKIEQLHKQETKQKKKGRKQ